MGTTKGERSVHNLRVLLAQLMERPEISWGVKVNKLTRTRCILSPGIRLQKHPSFMRLLIADVEPIVVCRMTILDYIVGIDEIAGLKILMRLYGSWRA
jgi:hypothetical protein